MDLDSLKLLLTSLVEAPDEITENECSSSVSVSALPICTASCSTQWRRCQKRRSRAVDTPASSASGMSAKTFISRRKEGNEDGAEGVSKSP